MRCFRILIAIPLLLFAPVIRAQSPGIESISIEHGLSQGMIFDITETRDGFLWIATKDGLNRYDGYNFKVFSNDPFDPYSLSDNNANCLFEDSRGLLWVGTTNKGLDLFDRRTGRFHHFSLQSNNTSPAVSFHVVTLAESGDGAIWILQRGEGVVRLAIPDNWKNGIPPDADLSGKVEMTRVTIPDWDRTDNDLIGLWTKTDGNLIMLSQQQQFLIDAASRSISRIGQPELPGEIAVKTIGALWKKDKFQLTDSKEGLHLFQGDGLEPYNTAEYKKGHLFFIQHDGKGNVWLLFGNKLWQLDTRKTIDFTAPDWVLDRDATSVTTDRNGNIWVGTFGYGLRKIIPKQRQFHSEASGSSIWRLWRTQSGQYFWRNFAQIFVYDPLKNLGAKSEHAFPDLLLHKKFDVHMDPNGEYWVLASESNNQSCFLRRYDQQRKPVQTFPFPGTTNEYTRLVPDNTGHFWITAGNCQLIRFNRATATFDVFDYSHLFGEKAQSVKTLDLAQDGNGAFWIGTQQGLVKYNPQQGAASFELIQADKNKPQGLNNNSIACLLPDPSQPGNVLWIGTKGGGINRLDLRSGAFSHLTMANGLPDKVIYGILPGNQDPAKGPVGLWCSSNRGLFRLIPKASDPLAYDITTFSAAKGLQGNEFNTQAFFKAPNGELLFGGVNGFNHFFPESIGSNTNPSPVYIVGLEVNHEPATYGSDGSLLRAPLEFTRELVLNYDQNNVSFEFVTLDLTDPEQNRYRYRLVGLDADWIETNGKRVAHFTHLATGSYEFRVQGNNGEGPWQEAVNPIKFVVRPPWYRSSTAYLIYFLLLLGAGWQFWQFQVRRVKLREQLAFESREKERVKALEQMKTNFFSNITHEFRTPLTLIIEPLRQILKNPADPDRQEKIALAERNSQRLLGLVNQLLDLAKLESGSMSLDLRLGNLEHTVRGVFESFLTLALQRDIKLTLSAPKAPLPAFEFDANKVEMVLNNLLSNALKFTPAGGTVTLTCRQPDASRVELSVGDTGPGIPPDALTKIFDRFYQVDTVQSRSGLGTGIGLSLSKELAERMGGGISVESPVAGTDLGSIFRFWLPVHAAATGPAPAFDAADPAPVTATVANNQQVTEPAQDRPLALIVEDNADMRRFIRQSIGNDWQVIEASDGEEGYRQAVDLVPDLVISDVMMPQKDGYALCHELKNNELTAHVPVILLTAKTHLDSKIQGLRTGADDYLTKPFSTEELLARMQNLVEIRRRLREHYGQKTATEPAELVENLAAPDREFIRKFILTLEENLDDEQLGVEDFAKKIFISRVQLHRKLKAVTNQSATDFIRDYRLTRAHAMLKNREGRVSEIAMRVGFGNEKYFSTVFKEKFGVSPSQIV